MRTPTLREIEESRRCLHPWRGLDQCRSANGFVGAAVGTPAADGSVKKQKIPLWLDLGVRDAMQDAKGPLYIATPHGTRLDDVATATFHAAPDDLARLGFAVAHALDSSARRTPR